MVPYDFKSPMARAFRDYRRGMGYMKSSQFPTAWGKIVARMYVTYLCLAAQCVAEVRHD